MKKIYNESWIRAQAIRAAARAWRRKALLDDAQLDRILSRFPDGFYRANVWVKIALFLFTLLLNGCAAGLSGALFFPIFNESIVGAGLLSVGYGVGFTLILNTFIRDRRLFHSGIDNALLYSAVGALVGGLWLMLYNVFDERFWLYGLVALPVLAWAVVRYASRVLALTGFVCLLFTFSAFVVQFSWGKLLLPFGLMALAGAVYFQVKKALTRDDLFYWFACLRVIEVAALVVAYASVNVYVVGWGNALLSGNAGVPLAGLFYALTVLVPAGYVFGGLRWRDRPLLIVGLLATAASVVTFQEVLFHLPWGLFLALSGAVLVGLAIGLLRHFHEEKRGFTAAPDRPVGQSTGEAVSLTELPQTQPDLPKPLFGGGNFGGGGAGEGY